MSPEQLYKITFINDGSEVYELYAKSVGCSGLYGFIEVAELVFDHSESIVIDPTEERLQQEFSSVNVLHVPMHNVLKVEEVEKKGICKVRAVKDGSNITPFPARSGGDRTHLK